MLLAIALAAAAPGLVLLEQGRYLDARAVLEEQAAASPASPAALLALAELRLAERQPEQAQKLVDGALALAPEDAHAHYLAGAVLASQIDSVSIFSKLSYAKRMKAAFERAADLDADSAEAREALCEFYLRAPGIAGGSVHKARVLALELTQIDEVRGLLQQAQIAAHEDQDPAPLYRRAIAAARTREERTRAQTAYGAALLRANKPADAAAQYRALAAALPAEARPRALLAEALLAGGDVDGALAAARSAVEIDGAVAAGHFALAEALLRKGDQTGAKAAYARYLELAPPNTDRAARARARLTAG